jgi:hypothetical protein
MISGRLFLLGSTLCVSACMGSGYPTIRPMHSQAISQETPFERAYIEGKRQLAAGRAGLAVVAFERASRLDPLSVGALNGIGAAYDDLRRYDIALTYYKQALLLAPHNADTTNNIAVSLQLAGDPAAREWFQRAAQLDPANQVISANIVQAHADNTNSRDVQGTTSQEASASPPSPTVDANVPTLQRSGVAEFQLGLPGKPATPAADAAAPRDAMVIPIVARIDPSPVSVIESHELSPPATPSPAPTRAIAAAVNVPTTKTAKQPAAALITVSNCVGRTHMARRFREFFGSKDVSVRHITNAPTFDCEKTRLLARAGRQPQAEALARLLPLAVATEVDETMTDDIRLVLGRDLVAFDRTLGE